MTGFFEQMKLISKSNLTPCEQKKYNAIEKNVDHHDSGEAINKDKKTTCDQLQAHVADKRHRYEDLEVNHVDFKLKIPRTHS